jgi:hypothetical protein
MFKGNIMISKDIKVPADNIIYNNNNNNNNNILSLRFGGAWRKIVER